MTLFNILRIICAAAILAAVGATAHKTWWLSSRDLPSALQSSSSAEQPAENTAELEWESLDGDGARRVASELAARAARKLAADETRTPIRDPEGFEALVGPLLEAFFASSFDPIREGVLSHPARTFDASLAAPEWRKRFSEDLPAEAEDWPDTRVMVYLCERPGIRSFTPTGVAPTSLHVGNELTVYIQEDWAGGSQRALAQYPLIIRADGGKLRTTEATSLEASEKAFVELLVRFKEGYTTRVRHTFFYDRELGVWMPAVKVVEYPKKFEGRVSHPTLLF